MQLVQVQVCAEHVQPIIILTAAPVPALVRLMAIVFCIYMFEVNIIIQLLIIGVTITAACSSPCTVCSSDNVCTACSDGFYVDVATDACTGSKSHDIHQPTNHKLQQSETNK